MNSAKIVFFLTAALMCMVAIAPADVELRGKSAELRAHLSQSEGLVSLSGSGEVESDTDEAIVALAIVTKESKLKEAMEANYGIRAKLIAFLKKSDIPDNQVKTSRFSSTPNAGLFSKTASHTVHNAVTIKIKSEKQLLAIAGFVDDHDEVTYGGVTFKVSKRDALVEQATLKAIDDLKAKKSMYEKQFGVKLEMVRFTQPTTSGGKVMQYQKLYRQQKYSSGSNSLQQVAVAGRGFDGNFGEMEHFSEVVVKRAIGATYRILPAK